MEERNISIGNLNINYKIAGEGPAVLNSGGIKVLSSQKRDTVLILHGWGGSSDSWIEVQRVLVEKGYKVITLDFPGFGKSVTPPKPWGVRDYVDWLNNFIEEIRKSCGELAEPFFLLGHSFGGQVAVRFTIEYPEKVKKLILCASAAIRPKPELKTRIIYWIAKIGNAIFTPKHLIRFKDAARNIFYIFLRSKDYVKANGTMKETIKKVLNEDLSPDLSKIKTKTLIVWGKDDKMVPLRYAYIFKEKINNSELEIIPKIGHSPHLEAPEKLSEIILKFIKE